ncbi:MAG: hypothetical protein WKF71_16965 [Pyrinomonadaceae bacterium]
MSEENNQQNEETQAAQSEANLAALETPAETERRHYFTRRNAGIGFGAIALLAVLLAVTIVVIYRYGVFDNYVKKQFVTKMADIGVVFDADVFRVTVAPLKLELKNATFNDKLTGEKLFFVSDAQLGLTVQDLYSWQFQARHND